MISRLMVEPVDCLASFCREMHFSAETSGFLAILLVRFCLIGTCV